MTKFCDTKVVISGSASLKKETNKWLKFFQNKKFNILAYPNPIKPENFLLDFPSVHKEFYQALNNTDILFVANEYKNETDGYIGPAVFAEISFVMGLKLSGKRDVRIILNKKPVPENCFYEDICLWLDNGWLEIFDGVNI